MAFLEIAKPLAELGFSVIPLKAREKQPAPGIGATKRSRDLVQLMDWAVSYPDANVGIVADDNIVILETDDLPRFAELIKSTTGKDLPATLTACGSSPDRPHFFFRRTEKATNVGCIGVPGLFEGRFSNQYVVGPGSIHPDGSVYQFLNDAPIIEIPDWLTSELARLAMSQNQKHNDRPLVPRTEAGKVPAGGRHDTFMSDFGRRWMGKQTFEEFLEEAKSWNLENCEPPMEDYRMESYVRDIMRMEPNKPAGIVRLGGKELAPGGIGPVNPIDRPEESEYIIPGTDKLEGWFIREELNLVVGASGSGKTTVMLQILEAIRSGESVFNHPGHKCEYRVVMHDRSAKGFARTARRMRLSYETQKRIYRLSRAEQKAPAVVTLDAYLKRLEADDDLPDLLFIEGLDFWAHGDINKQNIVEDYASDLIELAAAWNVAIVGSVGCPKQKAKDKYQQSRDNINGSAAWGRKVETILFLMLSNPENPNSTRKMEALPRNGPAELFRLGFVDGQLVPVDPEEKEVKEPDGVDDTRKVDKQAEIISYIESLAPGTILKHEDFVTWMSARATFDRHMAKLAHPMTGWVQKDLKVRAWVVRDRNS